MDNIVTKSLGDYKKKTTKSNISPQRELGKKRFQLSCFRNCLGKPF